MSLRATTADRRRVVVVGGGLAGCCAAIEAARAGAAVTLLEKTARLGGNSAKATSGINACGTKHQRGLGVDDSAGVFVQDTLRSGRGGTSDPALVQRLARSSADAHAWLERVSGVNLSTVAQLGGHSRRRTHRPPEGPDGRPVPVGFSVMRALDQQLHTPPLSDVITVVTDATVTRLVMSRDVDDGHSRPSVLGVEYTSARPNQLDGIQASSAPTTALALADGVVLATGGFANDRDPQRSLLREFVPHLASTPTTNGVFATGDGVKLGRAIGATLVDMDKVQLHPTGLVDPAAPDAPTKYLGPEALRGSGGILINRRGERFVDELGLRSEVSKRIQEQGDRYFDGSSGAGEGDAPQGKQATFVAYCVMNSASVQLFGAGYLAFYRNKLGLFREAKDTDELAAAIGAPADVVERTLAEYGETSRKGTEACPRTGKTVFPSVVDENGPYVYAVVTPVLHYTMGGLSINERSQVQQRTSVSGDALFEPIEGLYAAGEVTAGVHGANRLGGNSLLECVVFGRIAGASAAAGGRLSDVLGDEEDHDED